MPARVRGFLERHTASRHYASWVALASLGFDAAAQPAVRRGAGDRGAARQPPLGPHLAALQPGGGSRLADSLRVFHHLGLDQVVARFPEIAQSGVYARVSEWVARWGVWALFVATVIPLPQTPALAVCAIAAQPLPLAFIALLAGKGLRYLLYAWLAAKSPQTARKISRATACCASRTDRHPRRAYRKNLFEREPWSIQE